MKIGMNRNRIRFAVPVTNDAGLDSVVSGHHAHHHGEDSDHE